MNNLIEEWNINDSCIILEPQEIFNCGIVGVTEDKCHLVYSYQKLTERMAKKELDTSDNKRNFEDCLDEACELVDYNTIRSLPYMNKEYKPIIMYELEIKCE